MHRPVLVLCALLLAVLGVGCATAQIKGAEGSYALQVSNSEKEIELALAQYFQDSQSWKVNYEVSKTDPDDIILVLLFSGSEGVPVMTVSIDSFSSNADKGLVTERMVVVRTHREVRVPAAHAQRQALLEWINTFNQKYSSPDRMYLDADGDLVFESNQNIVGRDYNLHAEQVVDMVVRMHRAWETVDQTLPAFARAAPAPTPADSASPATTDGSKGGGSKGDGAAGE